jgi:hypothetical protein
LRWWLLRPPLRQGGVSFKCFLFWLGYLRSAAASFTSVLPSLRCCPCELGRAGRHSSCDSSLVSTVGVSFSSGASCAGPTSWYEATWLGMWRRVGKARGRPCCGGFFVLLCFGVCQLQVLPLLAQLPALRGSFPRFSAALAGWAEERVSSGAGPRGSACGLGWAKPAANPNCGGFEKNLPARPSRSTVSSGWSCG